MTLWDKGTAADRKVMRFTVGKDYLLDQRLVVHDCKASIAHARMLAKIGILKRAELSKLVKGLNDIIALSAKGKFQIRQEDEDCHTAIESFLTKRYGDVGKKIHTARSRNDQVLTAIRLYERAELTQIDRLLKEYADALAAAVRKNGNIAIPGYTHMQKAMPSSIGMWLGSYRDMVHDNHELVEEVHEIIDQSPLGTAAGFGVPVIPIDRRMTAKELDFADVIGNPMKAQLSRGKFEGMIAHACAHIMLDLNRLSTDMMLFSTKEFGYITIPVRFCTGSSIMPQKKNPDVLELLRAKYHVVLAAEHELMNLAASLPSGYNRDMQLSKEPLFRAIDTTKECLEMMCLVLSGMQVNKDRCRKAMSKELFATEEAYRLVMKGTPFRDAYRKVGKKYK
jgi:argininosuccinate lyase